MIELTDEQIDFAHQECEFEHEEFGSQVSNLDAILEEFAESLTIPQLHQLAEAKNASVIEWVDFDIEDSTTWPIDEELVLTKSYQVLWFDDFEVEWKSDTTYSIDTVTHWAYLPTPKEK